ncbi:26.5 kDa heat shock protein, mitochondrial [Solanum tuberosum]|uniref:Small heat-shock protein n=1 Tax=Solanum tuberosum TaxID=4113 RepID=M1CSH0_SOLTU|nr:PREDICTED: 26.5 kDa heat shock protein, mitochondrial [Solanum tuberosum]
MSLARLALKSNPSVRHLNNNIQKQRWCSELVRRFSTESEKEQVADLAGNGKSEKQQVAVSDSAKKSKLFPRRRRRGNLWTRNEPHFAPALFENLPTGLGNALLQATENINKIFDNLNLNPSQLLGRYKEDDKNYKIRYDVPGLGKNDVKIMVEDGILTIKGEHKEEKEEEGSDDEFWSSRSYGYYNNSIVLPEDAKVDEIKAEMKDGVLTITIPKSEKPKKEVKEIEVM